MKNLPWKKIGIVGIGLTAVLAAVFYFIPGKGAKTFNSAINPAFGEYISSYTAGVVSSGSPIRVIFSKDAVDSSSIGSETSAKLFEFTPSIFCLASCVLTYGLIFSTATSKFCGIT